MDAASLNNFPRMCREIMRCRTLITVFINPHKKRRDRRVTALRRLHLRRRILRMFNSLQPVTSWEYQLCKSTSPPAGLRSAIRREIRHASAAPSLLIYVIMRSYRHETFPLLLAHPRKSIENVLFIKIFLISILLIHYTTDFLSYNLLFIRFFLEA